MSLEIGALAARFAAGVALLITANLAIGQTTRTWVGTAGDNNPSTASNWSPSGTPSANPGDTLIWDATQAGNLFVTNKSNIGGSGQEGITIQVTANHTGSLTYVNSASSVQTRFSTNGIFIASGAGAFNLGSGNPTIATQIGLGRAGGETHYFTNSSSSVATFNSDAYFFSGGGGTHGMVFNGSGNWNIFSQLQAQNSGSSEAMVINGPGAVVYAPTNAPGISYLGSFSGITVNGGIFKIGNSAALTNAGSLVVNGGTLDLNGFSITNNLSGAGNVDTTAAAGAPVLTVTNGIGVTTTISGSIKNTAGTLSLVMQGAGTYTLSGANTYGGATTVSSGTLLVNGSIGSGAVTVASGATFGGSGTVGGSVNWPSGSSAIFIVTNSSGANPLFLTVSGSVTLNNNSVTINVPGSTPLPVGTYKLLNAASGSGQLVASITSANYTGAGVAAGTVSTIATSGGVATLTVAPAGITATWTTDLAGGTGNWTAGANWSSNPSFPTNAGDVAVFGVGSAASTVTLNASLAVGGITFTNPNSFTIANAGNTLKIDNKGGGAAVAVNSGTNSIATAVSLNDKVNINTASGAWLAISNVISSTSGSDTLTKSGSGSLILTGNNTYGPATGSVGTVLSGGTLELANGQALGSGDLTNTASSTLLLDTAMTLANKIRTAAGTTITLDDGGNAVNFSGGFSGGGAVTKVGFGADVFSYSGASSIGSLNVNSNVLEIAAGTITANGQLIVNNFGILQVDSGATLNFNATAAGDIGTTAGTTSTNIINGTLNYNNANVVVAQAGSGALIINSGQFSCNQFYDGQSATEIGTVYLNGGVLLVTNVLSSGGGVNYFYFNGGTLKAKGTNASFWASSTSVYSYVENNPGTIDNGGYGITISQPLNSETGIDGGMIFQGAGVTTLTGANGYNGPTLVNAGTLLINGSGSIAGGNVTVANAAALGGTGSVGGNVVWESGSAASFIVTNNGSGNGTPLSVSGSVTLNNNSVTINVVGSTPLPIGVYTLMNSAGISGSFAVTPTFTGAGVVGGTTAAVSISGGSAILTVQLGGNTWNVDANGNWSTGADWSGNPVIPRLPGDSAILGVGSAYRTVALDTNIFVGSIGFTNANSFLIANAGKTLTLTNSSGNLAINVSGGTSNKITAPLVINGGVTISETVGSGLQISSGLIGVGGLNIGGDGTGILMLSGSNTYSGITSVSAGTLALASTNAIGTNTLMISGGSLDSVVTNLVNANNTPQVWLGSFAFLGSNNLNLGTGNVAISNALTVSVTNTLVVGGNINSGTLTVTFNGNGTLELDGNNTFGTVNSGVGVLVFGNDSAAGSGTLNAYSSTAAFASSSTATRTIHNVLGTGNGATGWTFTGSGNLVFDGGVTSYNYNKTVTVNNPVTTWNFALPSGAAVTTKLGSGTLVLAGANANTGGNVVTAGTLTLANNSALGTGPLTMNGCNLDCTVANLTNINNNAQTWNTNFTFLGSQNLDLGNGAVTMANNVTISVTNTLKVEGAISDGGSGYALTMAGNGTLALSGANTYTGNTTIQGGTMELAQNVATLANGSTVHIASGAYLKLDDSTVTNVVTALVLNGSTNAPGVYGSANSSGYIIGAGHLQVLTGPAGPTGPASLTNSFSGNSLNLSWPSGQGWRLQMQTNSLSKGLGTNWIYMTDGSINSTNIPVDPSKAAVFYRLTYP